MYLGFIWFLKGKSTLLIFERHANLKYKYGNRTFWCRKYYVDIAGKNDKAIAEYIRNQLEENKLEDQLTNLLTHLLVTSNNFLQMADLTCACRRCQYHRALSAYKIPPTVPGNFPYKCCSRQSATFYIIPNLGSHLTNLSLYHTRQIKP